MKTPAMVTGSVEMVDVAWIMQNTTDSIDGYGEFDPDTDIFGVDYERIIAGKATDYDFGQLVGTIVDRGFRVPIVLVKDYISYGSKTSGPAGKLIHGNGHHRMAAAILLCLDEIPVYWGEGREYMHEEHSETEDTGYYEDWEGLEDFIAGILWDNQ